MAKNKNINLYPDAHAALIVLAAEKSVKEGRVVTLTEALSEIVMKELERTRK